MRVAYLIQTYHLPELALRLAQTIRRGSPDSVIVVSHDRTAPERPSIGLDSTVDVVLDGPGGRGDFSTVERFVDCLEWLRDNGLSVDWVVNLTGQDYPIRPISDIENELADALSDAFLEFFPVMDPDCRWGPREGRSRYGFRYRFVRRELSGQQRRLLRPLAVLNILQPMIRFNTAYGLSIGVRSTDHVFSGTQACFGGSFYGALSAQAIDVLFEAMESSPALVSHFRNSLVPEEAFLQTVLVNRPELAVRNSSRRYYDFRGSVAGRPKVLTYEDLSEMRQTDAWFARKFDPSVDAEVLDAIDAVLNPV